MYRIEKKKSKISAKFLTWLKTVERNKFQPPTAYKMQDQGGLSKSTITHPGFRPVQDVTTKKGMITLSPQAANTMQYASRTTGRGKK